MTLRGMANVDPKRFPKNSTTAWIPLTMSARFEGPTGKPTSATREEAKRSELFKRRFLVLTQYQFHAPGRLLVTYPAGPSSKQLHPEALLLSFFYDDSPPSSEPLRGAERQPNSTEAVWEKR
jgi:hypothetical protein